MTDLAFVGRALIKGEVKVATVAIEDGVIRELTPGRNDRKLPTVALTDSQTLLPAAIDLLSAARDWGEAHRDTVETATRAALAGGITVLCDQPNTVPRIYTSELVRRRAKTFADQSYVDFGIQSHPPYDDPKAGPELREAGAFGLTFFQWDQLQKYARDVSGEHKIARLCGLVTRMEDLTNLSEVFDCLTPGPLPTVLGNCSTCLA